MKIIHCADIHISVAEKDYSLSVLREIINISNKEKADIIIFAGDIFDSFPDLKKLKKDFSEIVVGFKGEIMYLPGNHEDYHRNSTDEIGRHFLGNITLLEKTPFDLQKRNIGGIEVEFFSVPHQKNYSGFMDWNINDKNTKFRIMIAHAVIPGIVYTGDFEDGGSVIDTNLMEKASVDYAAMGHIHDRYKLQKKNVEINYSGSSRIWRKGEFGERKLNIIHIQDDIMVKEYTLKSAGCYREYNVPVTLEGRLPDISTDEWTSNDQIFIKLNGIVEDEKILKDDIESFIQKNNNYRKIDIDVEDIDVLAGISTQPLVKKYLDIWEKEEEMGEGERLIRLKAREMALNKIRDILRARV